MYTCGQIVMQLKQRAIKGPIMESMEKELQNLLDSKSVSKLLGISRSRLYTLINASEFPVIRVSRRRLRFDPRKIKDWLDARSQGEGY